MSNPQMCDLRLRRVELQNRWVAIDPRGGAGIAHLKSGAAVVDADKELDALCRRLNDAEKTSLTILYCRGPSQ